MNKLLGSQTIIGSNVDGHRAVLLAWSIVRTLTGTRRSAQDQFVFIVSSMTGGLMLCRHEDGDPIVCRVCDLDMPMARPID
jgi:hypothetical protein